MNDLDGLRAALREDFDPRPLDLPVVLARGGRLRLRRRLATGVLSAALAAAVLGAGAQLLPARQRAAELPAATAPAVVVPVDGRLGVVIDTGFGDWVIYARSVAEPVLPDTSFGVMLAHRRADGTLVDRTMTNEVQGRDRAPGFHAGSAPQRVEGEATLGFGYYVGDATKITARVNGRTVTARQATWSEDPSVRVFWFDPAQVRPGTAISDVRAYDRAGRRLPAGNDDFGVG